MRILCCCIPTRRPRRGYADRIIAMQRALTALSLLHGATLLALAWLYTGDEATLTADQRSFGTVMLGLAGALMLIGAWVVPRTPALAAVPFGLAGLLTLLARAEGWTSLYAHGGWALVLGVLAIGAAQWSRVQARRPLPTSGPESEELPTARPGPPGPSTPATAELANDILRQIPRRRTRKTATGALLTRRIRHDTPRVSPATRPAPTFEEHAAEHG